MLAKDLRTAIRHSVEPLGETRSWSQPFLPRGFTGVGFSNVGHLPRKSPSYFCRDGRQSTRRKLDVGDFGEVVYGDAEEADINERGNDSFRNAGHPSFSQL